MRRKLLTLPTKQVPYELLNKKFRAGQKAVDREVNQVSSACSDLMSVLGQPTSTMGQVGNLLEVMDQRLLSLKRKVCIIMHACILGHETDIFFSFSNFLLA